MAIDTALRRRTATLWALPLPDSAVGDEDRAALVHLYSGFWDSPADITAPTLSSPTASSVDYLGCTPQVTTDESGGTVYMVVVPDTDTPSAENVKNGVQSDGSTPALVAESINDPSAGTVTFTRTVALSPSTAYELAFSHEDAASNLSNVSTVGFTTDAAPAAPSNNPENLVVLRPTLGDFWR